MGEPFVGPVPVQVGSSIPSSVRRTPLACQASADPIGDRGKLRCHRG